MTVMHESFAQTFRSVVANARTPRTRKLAVCAIIAAGVAASAWIFFSRSSGVSSAVAAPVPAIALVKTTPPTQQSLPDVLTAFGDVATGLDVAVSFPRAGQISRLLVMPGDRVRKGAPLATLTSDPTVRLAYTQALNAVDFAQGELRRHQELFALQLATQSEVDAASRALRDAEALLATQRELGGAVGSATITAPFDGVVDSVAVAQGDRIQPGAVIVQLGHVDVLLVRLGIEPSDFPMIRVGMPVTLSQLDDSSKSVSVAISEAQGLVDPKTQLIDAVAMVPAGRASFLVPGMHMRATIAVGQHSSWVVPRSAVLTDSAGAYLFQVSASKAHRVDVTQVAESQGMILVTGALDPRLPVVVLGNYELQDGMPVREGAA